MKIALFVLATLAIVNGQVGLNHFAYQLPSGAELLVKSLKPGGFSCASRSYGYYADVDNGCQVFHVCLPVLDDANKLIDTAHYSFICGNRTLFDQQHLVCVHDTDTDCGNAAKFYDSSNAEFGKIPSKG